MTFLARDYRIRFLYEYRVRGLEFPSDLIERHNHLTLVLYIRDSYPAKKHRTYLLRTS